PGRMVSGGDATGAFCAPPMSARNSKINANGTILLPRIRKGVRLINVSHATTARKYHVVPLEYQRQRTVTASRNTSSPSWPWRKLGSRRKRRKFRLLVFGSLCVSSIVLNPHCF